MWAASAATAVHAARRVSSEADPRIVPLMGVTGAFVFAAQMINFSIPGTGSSGHLGGGLLLAALLGPHAAFLVIASVLAVQALFFADGGLLALGCNVFNLGFFPAFVAYPILFALVKDDWSPRRVVPASILAAEIGLLLGALGVVVQTVASGVSVLPFGAFAAVMLPIHAAIAVGEGVITAGVLLLIARSRPDVLHAMPRAGAKVRGVVVSMLIAALTVAFALSVFASSDPDGLEWSIARVTGSEEVARSVAGGIHEAASRVQERVALFPDYELRPSASDRTGGVGVVPATSIAGVVGVLITLVVSAGIAGALTLLRRTKGLPDETT